VTWVDRRVRKGGCECVRGEEGYHEENVNEINGQGSVGTMESLKRAQKKRAKILQETASFLILKYEDIEY
jgi:hypothetical protein